MANDELDAGEAQRRIHSLDRLCVAALAHDDLARDAWSTWLAEQDIDRASWSEVRLLGVVAGRLMALATGHPAENRLPGIRKFLWVQTLGCLQSCTPLLSEIAALDVPLLLLKGAARVAHSPKSAAERLIRDVDVLVPPKDANRVLQLAIAHGWTFDGWQIGARHRDPHASHHAWSVRKPGGELDIHHFSNHLNRLNGDDDGMWARARPASINGIGCLVAAPSDALLTSLVHGVRFSHDGARDWMVDAFELLSSGQVDWELFRREARRRRLEAIVLAGIDQIEHAVGMAILPSAIRTEFSYLRDVAQAAELATYAAEIWPRTHAAQEALAAMALSRALEGEANSELSPVRSGHTAQLRFGESTNHARIDLHVPDQARQAMLRVLLRSAKLAPGQNLVGRLNLPGLPLGRHGTQSVPIISMGVAGISFTLPAALLRRRGMTGGTFELHPPHGIRPDEVETIARWDFS